MVARVSLLVNGIVEEILSMAMTYLVLCYHSSKRDRIGRDSFYSIEFQNEI